EPQLQAPVVRLVQTTRAGTVLTGEQKLLEPNRSAVDPLLLPELVTGALRQQILKLRRVDERLTDRGALVSRCPDGACLAPVGTYSTPSRSASAAVILSVSLAFSIRSFSSVAFSKYVLMAAWS